MKKLIFLLIILATVNVANAGVVDLVISSLNGNPITPTKEITIMPSDWVNFDLVYRLEPGEIQKYLFGLSMDIYMDPASAGDGELAITHPDYGDITWPAGYWDETISEVFMNGEGGIGISGFAKDLFVMPGSLDDLIVLDHFFFHCLGGLDVILSMVENDQYPAGASIDIDENADFYPIIYGPGVTIHQPEPMTIALLGLGSLLLRRRKK